MARKKLGLGSGKVTAVQVAFIVERYLAENGYNNTLAHFRSEAASLLGTAHPRQAPKSMLSLVDILDDYISLKEQRIALGREKARIDQLLFGMQDIMYAYQSGGMLPPSPNANANTNANANANAASTLPVSSGPYAITSASPPASAAIAGPTATPALPVPNNKRKNSKPLPDASASLTAKKSCIAAHPFNAPSSERSTQGLQMVADRIYLPSQAGQPSSHNFTYPQVSLGNGQPSWGPSYSVEKPTVQSDLASMVKSSYNQPSPAPAQGKQQPLHTTQMTSDSTCPQTPPQAFCNQPDSSASPLEASCAINGNTILADSSSNLGSSVMDQKVVYDGQEADQEIQNFEIRSSENMNSASPNALPKDENHGKAPPSKLNPRKPGKRGHIKSRLDFNSSVATSTVSVVNPSAKGTSTECISTCHASVTSVEMDGGKFDFSDIPIIDPELDKFMSDFFMDFGLDSEELGSATILLDQPDEMSLILAENQNSGNAIQTSVNSNSHQSKGIGVLTEKDMNIHSTLKARNFADSSTNKNTSNCKGGDIRGVADQENVPIL